MYTAGAIISGTQKAPFLSSLSGVVYEDHNLDNIQEAGDPGIPNVSLTLYQWNGEAYVSTGVTTTTDANGAYKFDNLQPGQYQVRKTQPSGYFSVGTSAGTLNGVTDGTVTNPNTISSVVLQGGDNSIQNDFSESLPGKISGYVYYDPNNNGQKETGEPGIPNTTVQLYDFEPQPCFHHDDRCERLLSVQRSDVRQLHRRENTACRVSRRQEYRRFRRRSARAARRYHEHFDH